MDALTIGSVLLAITGGASDELGKQLWDGVAGAPAIPPQS